MQHWKNEKLFDDRPYHEFKLPKNVIPLPRAVVENTGHDDSFDNEQTDIVRARIFNLPRRLPPEDLTA